MTLRHISTNRTNFVIKKFVKQFRTNSIIFAIELVFIDEKEILLST